MDSNSDRRSESMNSPRDYLMEHVQEAERLDRKTKPEAVERQARIGGLEVGMRVADLGCGSGKTTDALGRMVGIKGKAVGIDLAMERIRFAQEHYASPKCEFYIGDVRESLRSFGEFDFVWMRFVLEYYLNGSEDISRNASDIVVPGGILCLVDLDNNCLNQFEIPSRLERTLNSLMAALQQRANFDPYAGRKLYSRLFDLGFRDIQVHVEGHHIIYGNLQEGDEFNWMKKAEVAPKKIGFKFAEYEGGYEEFRSEFQNFFDDPRRFTYSPLIVCSGVKPG